MYRLCIDSTNKSIIELFVDLRVKYSATFQLSFWTVLRLQVRFYANELISDEMNCHQKKAAKLTYNL